MEECIYTNPLPLLKITNSTILNIINSYLPYSIGMEFECFQKPKYNKNNFLNIDNILAVDVDSNEQRYRIPKGLKGMVCLWNICIQLKLNSNLDLGSSNHYHFDFTDIKDRDELVTNDNKIYILSELEKWGTALDLSKKQGWIRFFNSLGTLEIRIGEPSFDYDVIIKRLIQGSNISRVLKKQQNPKILISNIDKELELLKESKSNIFDNQKNMNLIKSRIIKV